MANPVSGSIAFSVSYAIPIILSVIATVLVVLAIVLRKKSFAKILNVATIIVCCISIVFSSVIGVRLFGGLIKSDDVDAQYRAGWVHQNRTDLLTSRGVGTSVLPVRLFCRPQIHLITIRSDK